MSLLLPAQRVADLFEPDPQRIIEQMRVSLGGLDLRVAEKRHPAGDQ